MMKTFFLVGHLSFVLRLLLLPLHSIRAGNNLILPDARVAFIASIFPVNAPNDEFVADLTRVQMMEAFRMSLADVQENPNILSGTDLKYIVRNSPSSGLAVTALNVVNITRKAFNGRGVDMVMGARLDSLTEGLANILQDADVIQLGYNSGSLMSHNDLYSSFLRITPCSAYDGKFIAQNLQSNFGWSRLAVFSVSDDMDSVDTLTEFTEEAALNGLTVVYTAVYSKYSDDLSSFLSSAEPFEPRVILLLMPPQNTVSFLRQAYRIGLLDDGVTVMGTSYSAPATMTSFFNTTDDVASLMKGFIVYQPDLNWTKNAKGNEFMQRFHSWPDSISYAADGITPICHNDTDDEGWYTIHEQRINLNPSLPFVCSGIVPSAISAMEISLLTGYIYDGMQALARGLDIMVRNATAPLTEISAHDLKRIIVDSVSFEGVTGLVDFSSGRTSSSIYGYGDRIHKIPYAVLNFNNDYYRKTGSPFRTIGYINGDRIYSGCDLISDLSCSAPVYNTLDNSIPSDSPSPLNQEIPSEFKTTVINVAYLFVALVATCMAFIAYYRNDSALKALQPLLLLGTLTGCLTCCLEMIAEAFHTATSTCILRFWAEHLSFYLILGSITAKMYRIHLIVNATKLQRVIVSQMLAVYVFLVGLIPFVLYLIIFSTVGEPSSATFFTISITGQKTFQSFCTMKQPLILYILFSVEALVIIIATTLNVVISHAPKIIHEGAAKLRIIVGVAIFFIITVIREFVPPSSQSVFRFLSPLAFLSALILVLITKIPKLFPKILSICKKYGRQFIRSSELIPLEGRIRTQGSTAFAPQEKVLGGIVGDYLLLPRELQIELCTRHIDSWTRALVEEEVLSNDNYSDATQIASRREPARVTTYSRRSIAPSGLGSRVSGSYNNRLEEAR